MTPPPVLRFDRVLGLDLSLTSTGYSSHRRTQRIRTKADGKDGVERSAAIGRRIVADATEDGVEAVYVEGYAFGRAEQAHGLGQLGGIVRHLLREAGIAYTNVPPAVLKKFATGKGNANKDAMIAAAIRKFGYEGESNDEADAWLLRKLGEVSTQREVSS